MSKFKREKLKKLKTKQSFQPLPFEGKKQIMIEKEAFKKLRKDKKFVSVVNLGRFSNALMSSLDDYLRYADDKTVRETRQKFASFFANLGYLHEGINLCFRLKEQFEGDPLFNKHIGNLLVDPKIVEFNNKLAEIRSTTAFHFFDNVVGKVLNELNFKEDYVFMSAEGGASGDMYFELSDNVNINYFVKGQNKEKKALETLTKKSSKYTKKITKAVQDFIWEYMLEAISVNPNSGIYLIDLD